MVQTAAVKKAPAAKEEDDDLDVDDGGEAAEEIGKTFVYRSVLSASEAAALESFKRPTRDEDEPEAHPLPAKQRNATYGDIKQPLRSMDLGSDAEALCIAASSTGNMLAVGGRHGTVQLLNPHTLERVDTIRIPELGAQAAPASSSSRPGAGAGSASTRARTAASGGVIGGSGDGVVTSLCFRPDAANTGMQNVLVAAQGNAIVHLHTGTHKVMHAMREEGNKINTLCMRQDGKLFASAGSDCAVRVYDAATCAPSRTLDHGDGVNSHGHSNHVFSIAWQPDDPQVLLSGGWDNSVLVWDLRVQRSVRSISGPYICGDALDVQRGLVLTGSWRSTNPLQLWDLASGKLLSNLPWWQPEHNACLVYAARFGTGAAEGTVLAGGSGSKPMMRVYKMHGPGNIDLHYTMQLQRPVHALAVVPAHGSHGAPGAHGADAVAAVCCDTQVLTAPLSAGVAHHK